MNYTLGDLRDTLDDLIDAGGEDTPVFIAHLGYRSRMQYRIDDVVEAVIDRDGTDGQTVVYLVESSVSEYLPVEAVNAVKGES